MPIAKKSFRIDELWVQVYKSEAELGQDVAEITHEYLQYLQRQQDTIAVLLATGNSQIKFLDAFTLTIPMICSAKKIFYLAPGKRKANVVKQMLSGDITTNCPASFLRKQPHATLFLDVDSAAFIESRN